MNHVKVWLFTIISSALLLWATLHLYDSGLRSISTGQLGKINAVMSHSIDEEVMIWGASTALVHINPQIISKELHLSSYNMGLDGTGIDQYNGLLEEYLSYSKRCKYLIIVLDIPGSLGERNAIYSIHLWNTYFPFTRINRTLREIDPITANKCDWIPFFRLTLYDRHSFALLKDNLFTQNQSVDKHRGFTPKNIPSIAMSNYAKPKPRIVNISERPFDKLRTVCSIAKQKGIQPIISISPCYIDGLHSLTNKEEFIKKVMSLTNENVIVLNQSETELSYQPELFYNNTHMTAQGADLYTSMLASQIKSSVPDLN